MHDLRKRPTRRTRLVRGLAVAFMLLLAIGISVGAAADQALGGKLRAGGTVTIPASETSIFILEGSARYTWGPTGLEQAMGAEAGDFVYIPAGEIHVEENASTDRPLVVVLTRNCPDAHVVYLDDGPPGAPPGSP